MIEAFLNDSNQMAKINARKSILAFELGNEPLSRQETLVMINSFIKNTT